MAATQLARHLGAEVFGTASEAKWGTMRELGYDAEHTASSRTLGFEQKFLTATGGRGMNLVLDSLANEFVDASLRLLPNGGHFLEMGKTDVREPARIAADYKGVHYKAFDLMVVDPELIQAMFAKLVKLFEDGALQPLTFSSWDIRKAPEAFRYVSQAKHVGKVVFELPHGFDPDGTVLITGGTGALGSMVARHLIERHGARHLLLVSRQGEDSPSAKRLSVELELLGAEVTLAACDAADLEGMRRVLDRISAKHPLTAVFHTAGVLDDGVIASLTPERIDKVFRPKVDAARTLHELTAERELGAFVLFSSIVGVMGNAGQGSYAAANAYIDALAARRQASGLPAISLAWGPWGGEGMAARLSDADRARMRRRGLVPLAPSDGLALLDTALGRPDALLVPAHLDTSAVATHGEAPPTMLRGMVRAAPRPRAATATSSGPSTVTLEQRLAALPESERDRAVLDLVRSEIASVLDLGRPESLGPDRPLKELGLDSLVAVELRNRLQSATGLRLPSTLLFDYPTPGALAKMIRGELKLDDAVAAAVGTPINVEIDRLETMVKAMSYADLERTGITTRLRKLVARFQASNKGVDTPAEEFADVSDDELFSMIDSELKGMSS
jgi:polyketide synthase 12